MAENAEMDFIPMSSIQKKPDKYFDQCSDWVATEKVHGSSFQLYTSDGLVVNVGSRRRALEQDGSFVRCNIKDLLVGYQSYALKSWHVIHAGERWAKYREPVDPSLVDSDDEGEDDDDADAAGEDNVDGNDANKGTSKPSDDKSDTNYDDKFDLRMYAELYGGGGIKKGITSAVQKEIIYCDEFRLYIYGMTVNRKWLTSSEFNDVCEEAGFPYYAKPVCEPRKSFDDLKTWLEDSGIMKSKSVLSEKEGDEKTRLEGVVMTPLTRPDFRLHAIKYLAPSFNDVRQAQYGTKKTANFCTKQRYHSVISKLDIPERQNTQMVVDMFIADVIKESSNKQPTNKLKDVWSKLVTQWLKEDGYVLGADGGEGSRKDAEKPTKQDEKEDEDDDMGMGLFDS